jgi:hypothetical protein
MLTVTEIFKKCPFFTEAKGSLPYSQEPYLKQEESSPHPNAKG